MRAAPETLRAYAEIFEKPRRGVDGLLYPPTEIELVAAHALRFTAAAIEAGITAVDPDRQPDDAQNAARDSANSTAKSPR